ncbi:zymogen granule membrane protein 16 isoform X2 [Anolis carolinensis]|uniref:zymogen granule membrane protein 16 isoform X2 n=1 Tax=Anolis carolinensis TaxID=28377 RepID=UPI002F2B208F
MFSSGLLHSSQDVWLHAAHFALCGKHHYFRIQSATPRLFLFCLQFSYCRLWSEYVGGTDGEMQEIFLYDDEDIIQITGKYDSYIQNLVFLTNKQRSFVFGASSGYTYHGYRGFTFNAVPLYRSAVLRYVSGRSASYIDALGFHWGKQLKKSKKCRRLTVDQGK